VRSIDEDDGEHYLHDLSYVAYAYIWLYQMLCDSEVTWKKRLKPCALRHWLPTTFTL